jgi:cyclic beta-1,2-glucan synthetase
MRQQSWVVAYIDSARPFRVGRALPRPVRRTPALFVALCRADERPIVWLLPDLEADRFAEALRDDVEVVIVVPVPTPVPTTAALPQAAASAYAVLEDSWRYQLHYLDPTTESRLGAAWGLAEGAYEVEAGPISLLEHRYVLEDLEVLTEALASTLKAERWKLDSGGKYRGQVVADTALDRLVRADEPSLRSVLRREIGRQELSYTELLSLPGFITAGLFDRLADIVRQNRLARSHDAISRRAVDLFGTLADEALTHAVAQFAAASDDLLVATVASSLAGEPALQHLVRLGRTSKITQTSLRNLEETRRRQFARYVTVARLLARLDWTRFLEAVDPVYAELATDQAKVYPRMTAETRQRYRLEVARLARWTGQTDLQIAQMVAAVSGNVHNGEALFGELRTQLEIKLQAHPPMQVMLARLVQRHATISYFATITILWLIIGGIVAGGTSIMNWSLPLVLILIILALQPAIELTNFYITRLLPARFLPELDVRSASELGTPLVVAVPTILSPHLGDDLRRLELRFLANRLPGLAFGLLTDWSDAVTETIDGDQDLLDRAVAGIAQLQERYPDGRFYLFHRPRIYAPGEGAWIGRERKRGKLEDFIDFLVTGNHREYLLAGDIAHLAGALYLTTLDADTTLPPGAASRLFGSIAHPLNRHYGIVQPHVTTGYKSATANGLSRLYNSQPGVDPYLRSFSDAYFDLSGDGIYHGKGVLNVTKFYERLHSRFPSQRILSHDLLEGSYVGVALATDIVLYDEFPPTLAATQSRDQRWIRGDWQLLPWLRSSVPTDHGREPNPLGLLSQFKILDNLRRSLSDPLALIALFASIPGHHLMLVAQIIVVLRLLSSVVSAPVGRGYLRAILLSMQARGYELTVLPYRALRLTDAILRALWRSTISHRHLLQWRTAAEASGITKTGFDGWFLSQALVALFLIYADHSLTAMVIAIAWFTGYLLTIVLERARPLPVSPLTSDDRRYLRRLALQTWQYFDDFMVKRHHYLPPDNFQVAFKNEVAPRTSPTNIGLGLVAWLEAVEFGFTTISTSLKRIELALGATAQLERYHGHLYNWYDVTTATPVGQRFVSTVDSGNLVMSLWALNGGLSGWQERPLIGYQHAAGLADMFEELITASHDWPDTLEQELREAILAVDTETTAIGLVRRLGSVARLITARQTTLAEVAGQTNTSLRQLVSAAASLEEEIERTLGWYIRLAELPVAWRVLSPDLDAYLFAPSRSVPSLNELAGDLWRDRLADLAIVAGTDPMLSDIVELFYRSRRHAIDMLKRIEQAQVCTNQLATDTDFKFLYDSERRTFHIGYDVDGGTLDRSYYDLLASEARTASFVAIAGGQVPARHWWALGRNTRVIDGRGLLLSWSGTMFEYLMPRLFLRSYPDTLLDQALVRAVRAQQAQAAVLGVPWGISESGHSDLDADDTYQYHAYGVQSLAVQAVPEQGTVIAPYASCLALMVDPLAAIANLRELDRLGVRGRYGFFEAIDYRRPYRLSGERGLIVYSYMAHHQGMALLALSNVLHDDIGVRRVERDARVAAASPLLQERLPRLTRTKRPALLPALRPLRPIEPVIVADAPSDLARPIPPQYLFTNGRLTTLITGRGSSSLRWRGFELNRWLSDPLLEQGGLALYIRDDITGRSWQVSEPSQQRFIVESLPEGLSFESTHADIRSRLELMVAPEADVEIRYLRLFGEGTSERKLSVTSFFEFGLADHLAQRAHPAFNQLFIATEALPEYDGVLGIRRHRSDTEQPLFVAHLLVNLSQPAERAQLGNDRTDFIGRVGDKLRPAGLDHDLTMGASIDPAAIVRQQVTVPAGGEVELAVLTIVGDSRETVMRLAERYRQSTQVRRVRQAAWGAAEAELQRLQTSQAETELFQRLGSYVTYPNSLLKGGASGLVAATVPITAITPAAAPIIIAINDQTDLGLLRQLWLGSAFLNRRGYHLNLLAIIRTGADGVNELAQPLESLRGRLQSLLGAGLPSLEVLSLQHLSAHDLTVALETARVVFDAKAGSLAEQLAAVPRLALPRSSQTPALLPLTAITAPALPLALGGFDASGQTYQFTLDSATTPAPWSNVIANAVFGTIVTERGSGFTWDGNSQESRLTPWRNDPADDRPSEGWYVWEAATSEFWSILPLPGENPHLNVEHSIGRSNWQGTRSGLQFKVEITVPQGDIKPRRVRISTVTLTNTTSHTRELTLSSMAELSLGRDLEHDWVPARSIYRSEAGALLFRSPSSSLRDAVIYAALDRPILDVTTSRAEAVGPIADRLPLGLTATTLSGRVGREFRPAAVLRTSVTLKPGETITATSYLGAANNESEALKDITKLRSQNHDVRTSTIAAAWSDLTTTIQVKTPDPYLDEMLNHWLLYQVISSRLWGRTGYYQSSGAFGFRDQLQDVMALVYSQPDLARMQILTAANHQFVQGDVHHWWQPLSMWGLRSRISDDRLWLPYVVAHYVRVTGDHDILTTVVPYIDGPILADGQSEAYYEAAIATDTGTILDHCRRAIAVSSARGTHGLPLMGSGDWCDGYNRVGLGGTGETVWGAWFLATVQDEFAALLDPTLASEEISALKTDAAKLRQAADESWDGKWYRRGYYDDGTPLGSNASDEGKIDSLAQSWAVMSGRSSSRERQAIESAIDHLVDDEAGIVRLLAPSFDRTIKDPGYIRGYLPGVRENGGQYTHGSIWLAIAAARLGQPVHANHLLSLMLPTWHGATPERQARYAIEPYVMAGDVYALPGLEGRGGWSWYSGAAGWMYRAWIEEILGLSIRGNTLTMRPVIPATWPGFELTYRYKNTSYQVIVHNSRSPEGAAFRLDGSTETTATITLVDDRVAHQFEMWLG